MLKEEGREGEEEDNEGGGGRRRRKPQQQLITMSLTCTMQGKIGLGNEGIMATRSTTDTWKGTVKRGSGDE